MSVNDPLTGVPVSFPNLSDDTSEDLEANLIMPEPTAFLSRDFPVCSIIRPTATKGAAMGAVAALAADGLFIGQSDEFYAFIKGLAEAADAAKRGGAYVLLGWPKVTCVVAQSRAPQRNPSPYIFYRRFSIAPRPQHSGDRRR